MQPKSITTSLNYTLDNGVSPNHFFYERGPDDVPHHPAGTDAHEVEVHNGWPEAELVSLDKEGFEVKDFDPSFRDFDVEEAVQKIFYQQTIDFVKATTGAGRVEIFDHTLRRRMPDLNDLSEQTELNRPAVQMVHCDYTEKSGPQRVRDCFPEEADDLLSRRVAFYNVWKPLYNRVEELPLAMCDVTSVEDEDLITVDLIYEERVGEVYVMKYSPRHRWLFFPELEANQALILKTYDSETDGRARFMAHTACEDPNSPSKPIPRESIEIRTMAFF